MDSNDPTVIFLTMHKGGSSFIANGFAKAMEVTFPEFNVVNVGNQIDHGEKTYEELTVPARGSAFVRVYPKEWDAMIEEQPSNGVKFKNAKVVILQRDPRDAAVSRFYSSAYSHSPPPDDSEGHFAKLRAFLQRVGPKQGILRTSIPTTAEFSRLHEIHDSREDVMLTTYERMITDPRGWLADIGAYLNWTLRQEETMFKRTLRLFDFPLVSEPDKHIRRITPGNWLRFDQPELRELFAERTPDGLMERAGYPWPRID